MKVNRRKFLVGLSFAALVASNPNLAEAWIHGSAASGHNGGETQVNLNFPQIGGDYPFIDNKKNFGPPSLNDNYGSPLPSDVSADGYPVPGSDAILNHFGFGWVGFLPSLVNGGAIYAVRVTGKGRIAVTGTVVTAAITSITPGATTVIDFGTSHHFTVGMEAPVSGVSGTLGTQLNGNGPFVVLSTTSTGIVLNVNTSGKTGSGGIVACGSTTVGVATGGRVVVDITAASIDGGPISAAVQVLETDAVTPISDVAYVRVGSEETRYNSGEIFGIDFLNKLAEGRFGVIRHLNTLNTNLNNVVNWADRTPITYATYGGTQLINSKYAGVASGEIDFAGTLGSGGPVHGTQITTQFPNRAVTVSNSGGNALVNLTSHGFNAGDVFNFCGRNGVSSAAAGNAPFLNNDGQTINYYILSSGFTANAFQFSLTPGGTAIAYSSAGSGLGIAQTIVDADVTFTSSSSTIAWSGVMPPVGSIVSFVPRDGGSALPTNINSHGGTYFVKTSAGGNITISATLGGAAIVAASSTVGTNIGIRVPTYNLNGSGAVPILSAHAQMPTVDGNTIPRSKYKGTAQCVGTMTYDAVIGCWLLFGANDGFSSQGLTTGWPPEVCFALCNHPLIRAHPWFPSPPHVLDPISDFMPSLASYLAGVQPSWMIPRIEIHNELWNNLFPATGIAFAHAARYKIDGVWSVDGYDEYAGKVGSVLGQAVNNAYGNPAIGTGYQLVIGVWTAVFSDAPSAAQYDSRLSAAQYVAQSTPAQSGYTKSAACNWATHVASAQYITPPLYGTGTEATLAAAFDGVRFVGAISGTSLTVDSTQLGSLKNGMTLFGQGITTPVTITGSGSSWTISGGTFNLPKGPLYAGADMTAIQTYLDSLSGTASPYNLAYIAIRYGVISTWSRQSKFNNNAGASLKQCGYEGGYSPDYTSGGMSQVDMLRLGASYLPDLQTYTTNNYDNFLSNTGAEYPSCFQFTGSYPQTNAWSVLNDLYMFPLPPQWNAIVAYNQ